MSDQDLGTDAWNVPPSQYLGRRPATYRLPKEPFSEYVTMSDGCKIAVDVYLPHTEDGAPAPGPFPSVTIFTPYYRRFALTPGSEGVEDTPNTAKYRDMFTPRGYAVVVIDVRGTGASFGCRNGFRSPEERKDSYEIVEWIVAQPWSDKRIGATGISYLGAASDFLASTGHPAVKAIAPLCGVWDTYSDHYYPGGILLNRLANVYDDLMVGLDLDDREMLKAFSYYNDPRLQGPRPVDADTDGSLCKAAVHQHRGNFRMPDFIADFRFKEEPLPYDENFSSATFSPYSYSNGIPKDVAVLSVSGWTDGAGYANGAIARFLTLSENPGRLLLGPWDHGARINSSPWRSKEDPEFPILAEVLRFFDHYLMEMDTGLEAEAPVHYFCVHDEAWRAAPAWPPVEQTRVLQLDEDTLTEGEAKAGKLSFKADFSAGTGAETRYERIAAFDSRNYYIDWAEREAPMPSMDSAVLGEDTELTGHVVADIWMTADQPDAALFAYLSEVEGDGTVRYVTEGLLRALHRAECAPTEKHRTTWPVHPFTRAAAQPIVPGEPVRMRIALLPISWGFKKGSRIRLSFAGADADHCMQVPHGRPPEITLLFGGANPSTLTLPLRPKGAAGQ